MTMESPKSVGGMEQMIAAFISKHPEYAEKEFSQDEVRQVAALLEDRATDSPDDVVRDALDARLAVRAVAGKTPVINDNDEVIGLAGSPEEGRELYRENNRMHDSL